MDISQRSVQVAAIISGLNESHVILSGLIMELPDAVLNLRRAAGHWTIAEHGAHLAEVQPMLAQRVERILNEDTPEFVPFIPDENDDTAPPDIPPVREVLASFKEGRDRIVQLLGQAGPEDWKRMAVHPEYDQYGLLILARHILMHDHWHMYRMEELWLTRDSYLTNLEG